MIVRENIDDFSLDHIFDCGQCFRWEKQPDGSYTGIAAGRPPVNINFHPYGGGLYSGKLVIDNAEETDSGTFWSRYLDLDRDYEKIKSALGGSDVRMARVIESGQGVRILRQDAWETLVSFIISQNNNIPRIKKNITSICENFGKPAGEYRGKEYFEFPGADVLAALSEQDLAVCRLGYRAEYIVKTARAVREDNCEKLYGLSGGPADEAFSYLTGLCGVGPKVANCFMLFSMGRIERFPIDVRIRQVMNSIFGVDMRDVKKMAEYAMENFGEYGGVAQQYLYYYIQKHTGKGD